MHLCTKLTPNTPQSLINPFPPVLSPPPGMVESVCLPYSTVLQQTPVQRDEMRDIVITRDLRPPVPDQWNRDEVCRHVKFFGNMKHSWGVFTYTWVQLGFNWGSIGVQLGFPLQIVLCMCPYINILFSFPSLPPPLTSLTSLPPSPSLQTMRIILRTITECWHGNSTVRLTPQRVKKTLWKLSQHIQPKMYDKNGKLLTIERNRPLSESPVQMV